jgi:deoxycytidylate deaminase
MRKRPSLDDWAKEIVDAYAARGTCSRRQAAAVGFDVYGRIQGIGMNGVPRKFPHCTETECPGAQDMHGQTENCYAIHAEQNMILNAHDPMEIIEVYISCSPCKSCALLLCNLPQLVRVCYWEEYADLRGIQLLRRRGVDTILLPGIAS